MTTATITCHDVYNFGASLQAYALQQWQLKHGIQNIIIDYKPPYLSGHFSFKKVNPRYDRPVLRWLYRAAKFRGRYMALAKKRKFDEFTRNCLVLSSRRYDGIDSLRLNPPEADCYIAGSDQIWNTLFPNGKDRAFYLDFGGNEIGRISYAASFATDRIYCMPELEAQIVSMLKRFDKISVRERSGLTILNRLGISGGVNVCDPVFLLGKSDWKEVMRRPSDLRGDDRYVLVYDCEIGSTLEKASLELAGSRNAKIYSINFPKKYACLNFPLEGPREFLWLIAHADAVVSNSFHATAFALIFQKDLVVAGRSEGINSRMVNLLKECGIENHFIDSEQCPVPTDSIDYDKVNRHIEQFKVNSVEFLNDTLK